MTARTKKDPEGGLAAALRVEEQSTGGNPTLGQFYHIRTSGGRHLRARTRKVPRFYNDTLVGQRVRQYTTTITDACDRYPCPTGCYETCDCREGPVRLHHESPPHYCPHCDASHTKWRVHRLINGDLIRYGPRALMVCVRCGRVAEEQDLLGPDGRTAA